MTKKYDYKVTVYNVPKDIVDQLMGIVVCELDDDTDEDESENRDGTIDVSFTGKAETNIADTPEDMNNKMVKAIQADDALPNCTVETKWHKCEGWSWDAEYTTLGEKGEPCQKEAS